MRSNTTTMTVRARTWIHLIVGAAQATEDESDSTTVPSLAVVSGRDDGEPMDTTGTRKDVVLGHKTSGRVMTYSRRNAANGKRVLDGEAVKAANISDAGVERPPDTDLSEPVDKMARLDLSSRSDVTGSTPMDVETDGDQSHLRLGTDSFDSVDSTTEDGDNRSKVSLPGPKRRPANINTLVTPDTNKTPVGNINEVVITTTNANLNAVTTTDSNHDDNNSNNNVVVVPGEDETRAGEALSHTLRMRAYKDWVNCVRKDARTGDYPIHQAVMDGDFAAIERQCFLLVGRKLSVDVKNNNKQTPLHVAVSYNSPRAISILLSHGARLDQMDSVGNTPVHLAVPNENVGLLETLLAAGCAQKKLPLNVYNDNGYTPLHMCCAYNKPSHARLLIVKGAHPDLKDLHSGRTALFLAVELERTAMVQVLLDARAKPMIPNFAGHTPLVFLSEVPELNREISKMIQERIQEEKLERYQLEVKLSERLRAAAAKNVNQAQQGQHLAVELPPYMQPEKTRSREKKALLGPKGGHPSFKEAVARSTKSALVAEAGVASTSDASTTRGDSLNGFANTPQLVVCRSQPTVGQATLAQPTATQPPRTSARPTAVLSETGKTNTGSQATDTPVTNLVKTTESSNVKASVVRKRKAP